MGIDLNDLFNTEAGGYICFKTDRAEHTFSAFRAAVQSAARHFERTVATDAAVVFIDADLYLFAVVFFALLQAKKEIILLPQFKKTLLEDSRLAPFPLVTALPAAIPPAPDFPLAPMADGMVSFFTSGSTGTPKLIRRRFSTLAAEGVNICETQAAITPENPVVIGSVVAYHIYGLLWRVLFPLAARITSDADLILSPEMLERKLAAYPRCLFATTPVFLDKILAYRDHYAYAPAIRAIYTSGGLLTAPVSEAARACFGVSPFEIFGSTETGGVASRQQAVSERFFVFSRVTAAANPDGTLRVESPFVCTREPYTMGDAVTLAPDARSFLLLGRVDRLVKIAEQRISLPEMEQRINNLPEVSRSHLLPLPGDKTTLGCVLIPSAEGIALAAAGGKRALTDRIRRALDAWFPAPAIPRKFRVIHEFPTNPQGKLVASELKRLFEANIPEPLAERFRQTETAFEARWVFLPDSPYFRGHFPGFPILPGVVQVYFARLALTRLLRGEFRVSRLRAVKFSSIVRPGEPVDFSLRQTAPNCYAFEYRRAGDGAACSSGALEAEPRV